MNSILAEFDLKRDPTKAIEQLQNISEFQPELSQIISKLKLVQILQKEIVETAKDDLGVAKRLLDRLDLQNENIVYVLGQIRLESFANLTEIISLLDIEVFEAITKSLNQDDDFYSSLLEKKSITGEKIFGNHIPYQPPSQPYYSNQFIKEISTLLEAHDWQAGFECLLRVEPAIPNNLRVPRMHLPLLQKYLWAALNGFEQLNSSFEGNAVTSLQQLQTYLNLQRFCFDLDHARLLKEALENI